MRRWAEIRRGLAKPMNFQPTPDELRRFLRRVRHVDGHWLWTGHKDEDGYGQIKLRGRAYWTHRFSYAAFRGPIPAAITVHHLPSCLVHACCCPWHLGLLTPEGNGHEGACRQHGREPDEELVPF
jgi:hypothetical protein